MKDIELPEPLGYMNAGHVHELQQGRLHYGYVYPKGGTGAEDAVYTADQLRAAVEADRAQRVPDDFLSHKSAWRAALVIAQGFSANEDDSAYWSHEIKAFDRAYAKLLASTPAQPAQQEPPPKECATPRACQYEGCRGNCHQEPPQPVERKPMTDEQAVKCIEAAGFKTWRSAHFRLVKEAERHHGIRE